jgi:hypothetical protein
MKKEAVANLCASVDVLLLSVVTFCQLVTHVIRGAYACKKLLSWTHGIAESAINIYIHQAQYIYIKMVCSCGNSNSIFSDKIKHLFKA